MFPAQSGLGFDKVLGSATQPTRPGESVQSGTALLRNLVTSARFGRSGKRRRLSSPA